MFVHYAQKIIHVGNVKNTIMNANLDQIFIRINAI